MSNPPTISVFVWFCSEIWKLLAKFPLRTMRFIHQLGNKMVKFSQGLPGDVEYFSQLFIKSSDPQSYSNGHKRSIFMSVYYEIPNFCVPTMVPQLWNWLQIISDGYGEKNSTIFLSNAPIILVNMCIGYKWGSGITPKTGTGGHASLGKTQQSQN